MNLKNKIANYFIGGLSDAQIMVAAASRGAKDLYSRIVPSRQTTSNQDLASWKRALQAAQAPENPNRTLLYDVYDNILVDNHLSSIVESRALHVLGSPFKVVDSDGKHNTDLIKLLQGPWFEQFLAHTMSSRFWGPTLVELMVESSNVKNKRLGTQHRPITQQIAQIAQTVLIPRRNCRFDKEEVLREASDENGIAYSKPPYVNTVIQIGDTEQFGLLYKAAPMAMAKKYALGSWTQYVEKFGVPFLSVTMDTPNPTREKMLAKIMQNMGSAGWGIFSKGEELNTVDTPSTSAEKLFDTLIERTNKEMSKLILGQTMTTDDGSSRSQAEVHRQVAEGRHLSDKTFVKNIVNTQLLPRLTLLGVGNFENHTFDWDNSEELGLKELVDTIVKLNTKYVVDPKYITEKTGIPFLESAKDPNGDNTPTPQSKKDLKEGGEAKPQESTRTKKTPSNDSPNPKADNDFKVVAKWESDHCCAPIIEMSQDNNVQQMHDQLLKDVYYNKAKNGSKHYTKFVTDTLLSGLDEGMGDLTGVNYDKPDHIARAFLRANVIHFAAAKSIAQVQQLNQLLAGEQIPQFEEFAKKAKPILQTYNIHNLKAEYNLAKSTAQNASRYYRQMKNKETLPYLIYKTAADNRVRSAHEALQNKVFKKDDVGAIYPPNGWGCRCEMVESAKVPKGQELLTDSGAVELLKNSWTTANKSEWEIMEKGNFNVNRADLKMVFDHKQFYSSAKNAGKLTLSDQGLKPFAKMNKSKLPTFQPKPQNEKQLVEWFEDKANKNQLGDKQSIQLTDTHKQPITLTKTVFKQHLNGDKTAFNHQQLENLLNQPDEIFLSFDTSLAYRYVKLFKDSAMVATVRLDSAKSWLSLEKWHSTKHGVDNARQGILTYTSSHE